MGKTYWMLVTDQENFNITRERGFSVQGIDTKNRRKAVRMGPEDRIVYYVSDRKGFAATATVTSDHFEEHSQVWKHFREKEDFPHRVEIAADVVLDEENFLDAFQIGPTLEYVKKWPPEQWPMAFFGMLHIIPQRDFNYLEEEMKRVHKKISRRRANRGNGGIGMGGMSGEEGGPEESGAGNGTFDASDDYEDEDAVGPAPDEDDLINVDRVEN